jgi:hypothetical protein
MYNRRVKNTKRNIKNFSGITLYIHKLWDNKIYDNKPKKGKSIKAKKRRITGLFTLRRQ